MNLVLDEAEEVSMKKKTRKPLGMPTACISSSIDQKFILTFHLTFLVSHAGRILLKGDNITLMQTTYVASLVMSETMWGLRYRPKCSQSALFIAGGDDERASKLTDLAFGLP
jgi:small nuclear ribonucleoprotein (snRNP)-like protein